MAWDAEYVLALRWSSATSARESAALADYLRRLSSLLDVTVVDGSGDVEFAAHASRFSPWARHLRPLPWPGRNGKVAGVVTGVRAARHERVVLADDDVRYSPASLRGVLDALAEGADLVRPQNVFAPLVWHARWDTGRSLLNRAVAHDFPGTHGVRRSAFLEVGGYSGEALFENLELSRTFTAHGRSVVDRPGTYVERRPPSTAQFWSQRVRQAYDSTAQPARMAAELSVLPVVAWAARRSPGALAVLGGVVLLAAERGRRRAGGSAVYERTAALWALPWVAERAVCAWLALGERPRGGAVYRGSRIPRAASSLRELRSQAATQAASAPASTR